ncbi:MAG: LPXTG cell wall anchor domain-containing protein, partial [Microbacterium sp.]
DQLTDANRGPVSAASGAVAGDPVTVSVGAEHAGEKVDVWLYSTPQHIGRTEVGADGTVTVTIPADTVPGAHRIAVTDANGDLIGWTDITITAADVADGSDTVDPAAVSSGTLASTGADVGGDALLAGALLLAGAALFVARRRRVRANG